MSKYSRCKPFDNVKHMTVCAFEDAINWELSVIDAHGPELGYDDIIHESEVRIMAYRKKLEQLRD